MLPPIQSFGADPSRNVVEADEVRVGPLVITKTPEGGAGIWIGNTRGPMIAVFRIGKDGGDQTGVGIYAPGANGPCNVCLGVDNQGAGYIQFARGREVVNLTFDDVKKLTESKG